MRIPTVLKYVGIVLVIDEDAMLILPFRLCQTGGSSQ